MSGSRRAHVLIQDNAVVARTLRAAPGEWFLVGYGNLEDARTLSQTAYRIREGLLSSFRPDKRGTFEATSTADQQRPDQLYPVELSARYMLRTEAEAPDPGTAPEG